MTPAYGSDLDAQTRSTEIGLDVQHASPPTQTYVGKDDSLWVGSATQNIASVVTVNARYLMPDSTIQISQYRLSFPQSRSMTYQQINLPECFLLSVAAVSNQTPGGVGSCFVEVVLSRFAPSVFSAAQMLCQGYSNINQPVTWPSGVNTTSVDCAGTPLIVSASAPAAGAEQILTVPSNAKWQILSLRFTLTTSATVANRFVTLNMDDGVNLFFTALSAAPQVASNADRYTAAPGLFNAAGSPEPITIALPNPTILMPGFRIRTTTTNLQVGDQYSAMIALVLEWMLP